MTIERTKDQLAQLLGRPDEKVIALSGAWGTGKTYLWNEVKNGHADEKVRNALYASLFGLTSIDHLKRKLIETAIPLDKSKDSTLEILKKVFKTGLDAVSSHYKALAAISNLNLTLMAPAILREKIIIIDDIERKHKNLGIDEVLGFVDEYSKQYSSRFILILNQKILSNDEPQSILWSNFREKIFDQELKLTTSPEEAFDIAVNATPTKYAPELKQAINKCQINNIRVISKIIKIANLILENKDTDPAIQSRVIPSIVLFSAIYYRGLDNGPDFKFALQAGKNDWAAFYRDEDVEPSHEEKAKDQWRLLMHDLGIGYCDEFEELLIEYLESGLYDANKIRALLTEYTSEAESWKAKSKAADFLLKEFWHHNIDYGQLLKEAESLPEIAGQLEPHVVTELHSVLGGIAGGAPIGEQIIEEWIRSFRSRTRAGAEYDDPFNRPLHDLILKEFENIKFQTQANTTIADACLFIAKNKSWGTLQETALNQATAKDFETSIRKMEIEDLRPFMREMIKISLDQKTYNPYFGTAANHFIEACKNIANDESSPRLSELIKRLFSKTALASKIAKTDA